MLKWRGLRWGPLAATPTTPLPWDPGTCPPIAGVRGLGGCGRSARPQPTTPQPQDPSIVSVLAQIANRGDRCAVDALTDALRSSCISPGRAHDGFDETDFVVATISALCKVAELGDRGVIELLRFSSGFSTKFEGAGDPRLLPWRLPAPFIARGVGILFI